MANFRRDGGNSFRRATNLGSFNRSGRFDVIVANTLVTNETTDWYRFQISGGSSSLPIIIGGAGEETRKTFYFRSANQSRGLGKRLGVFTNSVDTFRSQGTGTYYIQLTRVPGVSRSDYTFSAGVFFSPSRGQSQTARPDRQASLFR